MADPFAARSMKRKNVKGLALNSTPKPAPAAPSEDAQAPGGFGYDMSKADDLEIGVEFQLDLRSEDLIFLKELGAGNGGTVSKVMHAATKVVMAKKVIRVEAKKEVRKRIVRELHVMRDCRSPYIVSFYGAFLSEGRDVIMCMEYMDLGSLDHLIKVNGPVRIDVLGKITAAVLEGLTYLYNTFHIVHRDIKPSNVLINSRGAIKLCDFGVSGELVNSIAQTFVGTSTYMAPERIQGASYSVKSDIWSVGLTVYELATGTFPFGSADKDAEEAAVPAGILDLLQLIVNEPAPRLPEDDAFPRELDEMIQKCLYKDPDQRPTPQKLLEEDPFVQAAKRTPVDLESWAISMMERENRKSHLPPQLSPGTKALLRGDDIEAGMSSLDLDATPTSGDIPISASPFNGRGSGYGARPAFPPRTSSSGSFNPRYSNGSSTSSATVRPYPQNGPLPAAPGSANEFSIMRRPVPDRERRPAAVDARPSYY